VSLEVFIVLLAGFGTLGVYSFLIKENSFFRLIEHIFIGIAAGYTPFYVFQNFLWPKVFVPLLGLNELYGVDVEFPTFERLAYIVAIVVGLFFYAQYLPKRLQILVVIALTISLAASAGLAIKGIFTELVPQLQSSFKPILVFNPEFDLLESLSNIVFLATLLLCLTYFIFTLYSSEAIVSRRLLNVAKILLLICFGAFFGSTISARLSLLIERLVFLKEEWIPALLGLF